MPVIKKTAKELVELGYAYKVEPSDVTKSIRDVVALGIWSYLMSHDSSWKIRNEEIMDHFGIGRDRVRKAFKYLSDMGLLVRIKERSEGGKIVSDEYFCFALPCDGKPENPSYGFDSQVAENKEPFDRTPENSSCGNRKPENQRLKTRLAGECGKPENPSYGFDSQVAENKEPFDRTPENSSCGNRKPENQRLKTRLAGECGKPENPSYGFDSQVAENKEPFDRTPENPSCGSAVSLKINPLNKILNNKRSNNKPNGDLSDFVSGQHAYRDEQNKHDYSNPHPSIPSDVLSPAEIQFFKMGQIPVRFQNGNFSAEEIERIKKNNGLA